MKYEVTYVKAFTVIVDTDSTDPKDIDDEAYDVMVNEFINGDSVEPSWEMTDCHPVGE